jgi:hypothetical protein
VYCSLRSMMTVVSTQAASLRALACTNSHRTAVDSRAGTGSCSIHFIILQPYKNYYKSPCNPTFSFFPLFVKFVFNRFHLTNLILLNK